MSGHKKISLNKGDPPDQIYTQKNISTVKQPPSLLDLSAQATAKHCCSSDLDVHIYGLDDTLMRKVLSHSFPQDIQQIQVFADLTDRQESWERALKLYQENGVKEMYQIGFMYVAYLAKFTQGFSESKVQGTTLTTKFESWQLRHGDVRVSVLVEKQKIIKTTCSECTGVWCEHVFAAIIYRMKQPEKVTIHAPMTESLASLSRDQLQKLLQYAADEDPAGVLGRFFKFYNEVRDSDSKMNEVDGAPDPTFRGLQGGDQSQWSQSLDVLSSRISADLNNMIENREFYAFTQNRTFARYPDNYDITLKMESKFFSYINFVREFTKQGEFLSAAEIMQKLIVNTAEKMRFTTRSDCPSLARWWHDLSHIHALLVLRTEDKEARSVLLSTALHINATEVMREHIIQTSDWSELPSLTQLFPHETEKSILANCLCLDVFNQLSTEGCMMIESVLANQLQPNPRDLQRLLNGTDNCENTSYNEDVIVMLARLESLFYFDKDQQKIARLGLLILQKLSIQAKKYSILGQFVGLSSDKSDSGAPSSLIKLFCPGPPATSTKEVPESLVSSSFSNVQPMDTDSVQGKGRQMTHEPSEEGPPAKRARIEPLLEEESKPLSEFIWIKTHLAHAVLHTLYIIIKSQTSAIDLTSRKALVVFCLQALELSRYRTQAVVSRSGVNSNLSDKSKRHKMTINPLEYDSCLKLETTVVEYLKSVPVGDIHEAVFLYTDSMSNVGTSFYSETSEPNDSLDIGGTYPLILLEVLCRMYKKAARMKKSKSKQLMQICSEIILGTTSGQVSNTLLKGSHIVNISRNPPFVQGSKKLLILKEFQYILETFCKTPAVSRFSTVIETFYSVAEDSVAQAQVTKHLEQLRNQAILKMIADIAQKGYIWKFQDDKQVVRAMLQSAIQKYQKILGESVYKLFKYTDNACSLLSSTKNLQSNDGIEKYLLLYLLKRIDMSSCSIISSVWQDILTCKDLQDLVLTQEKKYKSDKTSCEAWASENPELLIIIDEFYDSKLPHDEDACTLLTRYCTPGSDQYTRITNKIIDNSEHYHAGALFHLAKLHLSRNESTVCDPDPPSLSKSSGDSAPDDLIKPTKNSVSVEAAPMDQETFNIVEKAFERLGKTTINSNILEAVECMFTSCVMGKTQLEMCTHLEFYDKLVWCVCHHAKSQPLIVMKILQCIKSKCGGIASGYLANHPSISELFTALFKAYKEYFVNRFKQTDDHEEVIQEMLMARVECKSFVHEGDREFDKIVKYVQAVYTCSMDKKLAMLLDGAFPSETNIGKLQLE